MKIFKLLENGKTSTPVEQSPASALFSMTGFVLTTKIGKRSDRITINAGNVVEFPIPEKTTQDVFEQTDKGENIVIFKDVDSLFNDLNS